MFSLKEKTALVTGASQGIGRATAIALAAAGARVALAARNEAKLAELAGEITAAGGEAFAVPMDVARPEQIKAGFEAVRARFGGLHILVNNAAITRDTLALRMKQEDWDSVLQVNLTAAHIAIQQALGIMLRQKWGRIINVSSVVARMGNAGQANYVAAKAGLIGLTKAIAVEVASRHLTVNAVAPGFVVSPMTDPLTQQVKDALLARIPLGRFGRDQEVAAAIVFLASEEAGYITGHVLDVNGGLYMA
jgi:3-oxoacyl-[acyl-carrier protein] reductase